MSKQKKPYKLVKKRSGRYAVVAKSGSYIHGEDKVKILASEGLIKSLKAAKKD